MPGYVLPPDVTSVWAWNGPGVSTMVEAATARQAQGAIVEESAAELSASVALLSSAGWVGPTGLAVSAAHVPHLAWLEKYGATVQAVGASQLLAAAEFTASQAITPTPLQVTENQSEHVALQSSNILGINTVPIGFNRGVYTGYGIAGNSALEAWEKTSALHSTPIPVEPPPPITSGAGEIASMISSLMSGVGGATVSALGATSSAASALSSGTGAAVSAAPAVAQAAGSAGQGAQGTGATGAPGTGSPGVPGKEDGMSQMMPFLQQGGQAAGQLPQAAGQLPQAAQGALGPAQQAMSSMMSSGGSGLGSPASGMPGMGGMNAANAMNPGMANSTGQERPKPAGVTRSAGVGGMRGGYQLPGGWRTPGESLGVSPAATAGASRLAPVGYGLGGSTGGGTSGGSSTGSGAGMMPPGAGAGQRSNRGVRAGSLYWDEDPFGADEDPELPMALTGERGT